MSLTVINIEGNFLEKGRWERCVFLLIKSKGNFNMTAGIKGHIWPLRSQSDRTPKGLVTYNGPIKKTKNIKQPQYKALKIEKQNANKSILLHKIYICVIRVGGVVETLDFFQKTYKLYAAQSIFSSFQIKVQLTYQKSI